MESLDEGAWTSPPSCALSKPPLLPSSPIAPSSRPKAPRNRMSPVAVVHRTPESLSSLWLCASRLFRQREQSMPRTASAPPPRPRGDFLRKASAINPISMRDNPCSFRAAVSNPKSNRHNATSPLSRRPLRKTLRDCAEGAASAGGFQQGISWKFATGSANGRAEGPAPPLPPAGSSHTPDTSQGNEERGTRINEPSRACIPIGSKAGR